MSCLVLLPVFVFSRLFTTTPVFMYYLHIPFTWVSPPISALYPLVRLVLYLSHGFQFSLCWTLGFVRRDQFCFACTKPVIKRCLQVPVVCSLLCLGSPALLNRNTYWSITTSVWTFSHLQSHMLNRRLSTCEVWSAYWVLTLTSKSQTAATLPDRHTVKYSNAI